MQLVAGKAQQIDIAFRKIERDFADCLHGIGMKDDAFDC